MQTPKTAPRLPPELLCRIVGYTPSPSDLHSLCLVTKEFRDAATPALYHHIVLDEKTETWPQLQLGRGLLSLGNGGLAHVRALTCQTSQKDAVKHLENHKDELQSIEMLLQFIPRHQLVRINLSTIPLGATTIAALFTQQNNLRSLALGPIVSDLSQHLQFDVFGPNPCSKLQELKLPSHLWTTSDLDAYGVIFNKAPSMSRLSIHSRHLVEPNRKLSQDGDEHNLIFSKFFERQNDYFKKHRNMLLSLHLDGVIVSVAAQSFPQYFDPCNLQELHISDCRGWSFLLKTIATCFTDSGYSLQSFSLEIGNGLCNEGVVEKFLRSFEGLKVFRYTDSPFGCRSRDGQLDLQCLNDHLSSLEQLALMPVQVGPATYTAPEEMDEVFEKICDACINLRQLGISMPPTWISGHYQQRQWYSETLLMLLSLPNLKALRIFNWPDYGWSLPHPTISDHLLARLEDDKLARELEHDFDEQMDEVRCSMALQQMDVFVAGMLPLAWRKSNKRHDCAIICFNGLGENSVMDEDGLEANPEAACYVPERHLDVFGRDSMRPRRIPLREAKHLEPENGIMQWQDGQ